jgi:putative oxidoreductase
MNNFLLSLLTPASCNVADGVICCMRIAIGLIMVRFGIEKIYGGVDTWRWLGSTMSTFGIYWLPVMWGLLATGAEFFGGILLTLGLGTRIAALFLACVMVVACTTLLKKGEPYQRYAHSLTLFVIFLSFMIMGAGSWSLDHLIITRV